MTSSNEFRNKFQYYCLRANYKQKELAEQLYVVPSTLSKWVNGSSPWSSAALTRCCEILEITDEEKRELFILAGIDISEPESEWQISKDVEEQNVETTRLETNLEKVETELLPYPQKNVVLGNVHQGWLKWGIWIFGIGLIMVLILWIFWPSGRPELPPGQTVFDREWIQVSAEWEIVNESTALLIESNPHADFGKVESEIITVNIDEYPILRVSAEAVDPNSSYTVQILDKQTNSPKDVLKGITYSGEQVVNLANEMGWHGPTSFTINIWISGEYKSVRFDSVSIGAE